MDCLTQGFFEVDLDCPKVEAVGDVCRLQFPGIELSLLAERFRTSAPRSWPADRDRVVFSCVDTIEAGWHAGPRRLAT